jgi:putative PIN family toxin of toxin-antitoxin system
VKVVLDTNVLISAFNFPGGAPEDVYRLAIDQRVQLVTSPSLLAELARILSDKFGWMAQRVEEAVSQVARIAEVVEPGERVAVITADPDDDRVLEAAHEAKAEIIVSGDKHLLRLGSWRTIRILSPADFLGEFE